LPISWLRPTKPKPEDRRASGRLRHVGSGGKPILKWQGFWKRRWRGNWRSGARRKRMMKQPCKSGGNRWTTRRRRRARRRWETQAVDRIAAAKTPISGGRVAPVRVVELNRVQFETRRFQARSSPSVARQSKQVIQRQSAIHPMVEQCLAGKLMSSPKPPAAGARRARLYSSLPARHHNCRMQLPMDEAHQRQ
jgi:hypothetical protein